MTPRNARDPWLGLFAMRSANLGLTLTSRCASYLQPALCFLRLTTLAGHPKGSTTSSLPLHSLKKSPPSPPNSQIYDEEESGELDPNCSREARPDNTFMLELANPQVHTPRSRAFRDGATCVGHCLCADFTHSPAPSKTCPVFTC